MSAFLKKSTPGKFAHTCHFQQIGINATKIDKTGIHFKTDVFAAVAVVDAKAPYIIHKHNVTFQFRASDGQIYMNFKLSIENGPLVGTDFIIEKAHRVGRPLSDSKPRKIVARQLQGS